MEQVYSLKDGQQTIYVMKPAPCDNCHATIETRAWIFSTWANRGTVDFQVLCERCLGKRPEMLPHQRQSIIRVLITDEVPFSATPFFFQPVELVDGGISTFAAARRPRKVGPFDAGGTRDLTRYAGRRDSTFLDDSAPVLVNADVHELLEEKDRAPDTDEGLALLDSLASAPPLLSESEKKRLEDGRGSA